MMLAWLREAQGRERRRREVRTGLEGRAGHQECGGMRACVRGRRARMPSSSADCAGWSSGQSTKLHTAPAGPIPSHNKRLRFSPNGGGSSYYITRHTKGTVSAAPLDPCEYDMCSREGIGEAPWFMVKTMNMNWLRASAGPPTYSRSCVLQRAASRSAVDTWPLHCGRRGARQQACERHRPRVSHHATVLWCAP